MIQLHEESGLHKFEHFVTLKWMLETPELLEQIVAPIAFSRWTLFTSVDLLPLCDSPVLLDSESLLIALSPHLLLHADLKTPSGENEPVPVVPLGKDTFEEFKRPTIGNMFREIIGDRSTLEVWQACPEACPEFQSRARLMRDAKRYNELVRQEGSRELWHINRYVGRI
jgi:hypothetical protein